MRRLLDFLYRRRVVALFIGLQLTSWWLIVNFNQRHNADFLNSSNALAASVSATSQEVSDYFQLEEINQQLMQENEELQRQIFAGQRTEPPFDLPSDYSVVGGRVVNNTFRRPKNFLTINVGSSDGIFPGMGVISPTGTVGQIKSVSRNYAAVYSLLHPNVMVSSAVKRTNTNGTVQWDQRSHDEASLKYIPRHIRLQIGDSIVTSGYNAVFPPSITVGTISELILEEYMMFYEAKVKLSTDFTSLPYVFVITDRLKKEKDSLQAQ